MSALTPPLAVIVGAGNAASEFVTRLRTNGWNGRILLIGEEPTPPYHRPPLSKTFLAGAVAPDSLHIKSLAAYEKAGVDLLLGVRVERIERGEKWIQLSDGQRLDYDKLVLATGGRARRLSLPGLQTAENVHYLRTVEDAVKIRDQLQGAQHVAIIGGGYVGLEMAAVAVGLGANVTVLEALPRLLARVTVPELSAFFMRKHQEAGVLIRTNAGITGVELNPNHNRVSVINCADGNHVTTDLVVVGIGLVPNVELAADAGLQIEDGIWVDENAQTCDSDIYAIGDCTNQPSALYQRRLRLESVANALEQARLAAATLCGLPKPAENVPWFWSDQYDLRFKTAGLSAGHDQLVIRGDTGTDAFSIFYFKEGRLLAADTVNRPAEFMQAKRWISEQKHVDPARLADETIPLDHL